MRYSLILLLVTLFSNSLFACLSASQNRLFPLGQTSKGLCVVETHLYRSEFVEKGREIIELNPAWGGISFFKIYDNNHKEIYSKILDTIKLFEQHNYESIIKKTFNKGLDLAKTYTDFVIASPKSLDFCDYQKKCSLANLKCDLRKNKINVQLANKRKYELRILFDSTSIASNFLNYFKGFDDSEISAKGLRNSLYINSVRKFDIGTRKLTILHIGFGQTYKGKEFKNKDEFNNLINSVFVEPVLHHGHGFDFFIWE